MFKVLEKYNNHDLPMIVGGDLNLDLRGSHGTEFIEFMRTELGLELSNDLATSTTRNSTCIDPVFYRHIEQLETRDSQSKMEVVKIKNLNKSHMNKAFIVKGRVKYIKLENNRNLNVKHLSCIIFDDSSEIQVIAYEDCDTMSRQLKIGNVIEIENGELIDNKNDKKTKHKYIIMLDSYSTITTINKDEVNNDDFPVHKYTSGAALKFLIPGMIIDVSGVLVQINSETAINTQSQTFRKGIIKVDFTEIEVRFCGKKAEKLYNVGDKLFLYGVKYITFQGCEYLSVEYSSNVRCRQSLLSRHVPADLKDFTIGPCDVWWNADSTPCKKNSIIESSVYGVSISSPSSSNKNFTIGSPDQKQSTSGSTPCNKRKSQDLIVEEVTSKILKIDEPKESFSDEKFTKVVLNLLKNIKNNKEVIKLRTIEFISEILPEND